MPAAIDITSGVRCAKTSASGLHGGRHILRLHREHHDVGAGHGLAIVGGDVHSEFVGERDATRLMRFADTDVLRRQAAGDEAANQRATHVAAADECCVDVHVVNDSGSGT